MTFTHRPAPTAVAVSLVFLSFAPATAISQPSPADEATPAVSRPPVAAAGAPASAQEPSGWPLAPAPLEDAARGLRLVYVTDNTGLVRACGLVAREAGGLRLLVRDGELLLPWDDIARVQAVGDPVHDGFFKGLLLGGGLGALSVLFGGGEVSGARVAVAGLIYGLIGMAIDAKHVGTTTLYVAPGMSAAGRAGRTRAWRPDAMVVGARLTF